MLKTIAIPLLLLSFTVIAGNNNNKRWYSVQQVASGALLFKQNCASCHGENAEGTLDWKSRDHQGFLPPPPLNGTAHTWHHDKQLLTNIIKEGGARYNGKMPPFQNRLSNTEIDNIIAYFQSTWTDNIYFRWADNFLSSNKKLPSFDDLKNARKKQIKSSL